ncbi:PAS domain S-box protein [Altererythrobacter confluentis]|uniref:Sensor protein FixL n=1 Tax=Allopontixanthobacter confluentis TaxID=1849021 RepID=A0A6L7GBE5_9SPHN|nr:PAS domain-containing sensor histidine kinase [Allopontixanthobacter confluentis]MXP13197.1 PAS domain S-box protein [Allopontixanthobacter confluentis]
MSDIINQEMATSPLANERISSIHALIDTVPDAMIVIDSRSSIVSFSKGAEKMFGYDETEVLGENVRILMPPPDREAHDGYIHDYLATGIRKIIGIGRVTTARRSDGTTFPITLSVGEMVIGNSRLFTGFIRDMSEQRETERQLHVLQAELAHVSRITSMGTLANSLAHELNQPLTAVANYVEAAKDLLDDPTAGHLALVRDALSECAAEALRAGTIIHRLREFIMRGDTVREIASLSRLVREATALALVNGDGRDVDFSSQLDPSCDLVLVVPVQIQQVLVNLIRNALEAMADSATKRIIISSEAIEGGKVSVCVSDSGPGLDPHIAERLFHPFMSTKASGMGLGLSICHTIINAHGGKIGARPSDMGGTVFTFTLASANMEDADE